MEFERIYDAARIKEILCSPSVWERSSDDFSGTPEGMQIVVDSPVWFVEAKDGEDVLGMFVIIPKENSLWEVHTGLLPKHGYARGRRAARQLLDWIWENTPCQRLITEVPSFNQSYKAFVEDWGMRQCGVLAKSFVKGGHAYDQTVYEVFRPGE